MVFILLIPFIIISQYFILKPVFGVGIVSDDLTALMGAVTWQGKNYFEIWNNFGPHISYQIFYAGILNFLFGLNFAYYIKFNILLKILATLSLYPLILLISKSKLMAFLGTLIFAFSAASAGSLTYYVTGIEYLGLFFMNLFLTAYYYSVKYINPLSSVLAGFFLLLTLLITPIRTFPIVGIICFVEFLILLRFKDIFSYGNLIRIACYLFPLIFLLILNFKYIFGGDTYSLDRSGEFQTRIANGNWYLLLNPISGVGYSVLPFTYYNLFGAINLSGLQNYFSYSLLGPFIIYAFIVLLLSFFLSKKPIFFFIITMITATVLTVITFILGTHHFSIPKKLVPGYNPSIFYFSQSAAVVTNLVVALSLSSGLEWWQTNRKNKFLLLIFISPFFALFFSISQWLFTKDNYMHQETVSRYLAIPQIGISIFFAGLLTLIYNKTPKRLNFFAFLAIGVFFLLIFFIGKNEVFRHFDFQRKAGQDLYMQNWQQDQILTQIKDKNPNTDLFIYVKFPEGAIPSGNPWAEAVDIPNLVSWMVLKRGLLTNGNGDGCVIVTWGEAALEESAVVKDNVKGFIYKNDQKKGGGCYRKKLRISMINKFIKLDNFYAFSVDGPQITNVTQEVINNLPWRIN